MVVDLEWTFLLQLIQDHRPRGNMCQIFVRLKKGNKLENRSVASQFAWNQLLLETQKNAKYTASICDSEQGPFQPLKNFLGYDLDQVARRFHSENKFANR